MRASSHGPFRTMMMIFPLLAVAGLAYLGGYHYHTLAASQVSSSLEEDDWGDEVVDLGHGGDAASPLDANQLFDSPLDDQNLPAEGSSAPLFHAQQQIPEQRDARPVGRNPDITIVSDEPFREEMPRQPQRRSNSRSARQYPSAAISGWQFADDGQAAGGDAPPVISETTATQPNMAAAEFDARPDETRIVNPRNSRLQAAIDARRNGRDDFRQHQQDDRMASISAVSTRTDDRDYQTPADFAPGQDVSDTYFEASEQGDGFARDRIQPAAASQEAPQEYRDPRSLKEATQILRDWGIRKFKLETTADGHAFRFLCGVTDLNNPSIRRLFVAEGDEPLAAVTSALRQIEDWRAQQ